MDRRFIEVQFVKEIPLRSLPRMFLPGQDMTEPFELPGDEADKLRKVLRLSTGDRFAVLPDDGSLWVCELDGKSAIPLRQEWPDTEPAIAVTLAQALPKGDRLETILRMGTEIGVARFILFPAERSVVRWETQKLESKLKRLRAIVRESAEQCFRCLLPSIEVHDSVLRVLQAEQDSIVLSEQEDLKTTLWEVALSRIEKGEKAMNLVVGPEGGWAKSEQLEIESRSVTLGRLVLRTDTAGPAAAAVVLMGAQAASLRNSVRM